eukprot:CAMPEP_0181406372 /NCGR_PEP_ID=MMETSP1110-20121109/5236_1 /TAXON_ID=174948 /ORGANISM="Symbiodinium sp., Strain CCMP421" /LENGTH=41 /DNA_ID= /DNA_START= /DNA_END= /DNA_ORIENTATION=
MSIPSLFSHMEAVFKLAGSQGALSKKCLLGTSGMTPQGPRR